MAHTAVEITSHTIPNITGTKTTFTFRTPWHSEEFPKLLRPQTLQLPLWKETSFFNHVLYEQESNLGKILFSFDVFATKDLNGNAKHELLGSGELNLFNYMMDLESVKFRLPWVKMIQIHGKGGGGNNNVLGTLHVRITMVLWPSTDRHLEANRNWLLQKVAKRTEDSDSSKQPGAQQECPSKVEKKVKAKVTFAC